jgi:hypothetical protein
MAWVRNKIQPDMTPTATEGSVPLLRNGETSGCIVMYYLRVAVAP